MKKSKELDYLTLPEFESLGSVLHFVIIGLSLPQNLHCFVLSTNEATFKKEGEGLVT